MGRHDEHISMPEYGVTDVANRVTYIPTRLPHETPEEALERGRAQCDAAIMELARLLGRMLADDVVSGRVKFDEDGKMVEAPWLKEATTQPKRRAKRKTPPSA